MTDRIAPSYNCFMIELSFFREADIHCSPFDRQFILDIDFPEIKPLAADTDEADRVSIEDDFLTIGSSPTRNSMWR